MRSERAGWSQGLCASGEAAEGGSGVEQRKTVRFFIFVFPRFSEWPKHGFAFGCGSNRLVVVATVLVVVGRSTRVRSAVTLLQKTGRHLLLHHP